jgi:hypothetical protein
VQRTLTDWQGKLRIADVVGDSLRILVRRPVLGVLAPTAGLALAGWLAQELELAAHLLPFASPGVAMALWTLAAQLGVAIPVLALCWAWLARAELEPAGLRRSARATRIASATALGVLIGLAMALAAVVTGIAAPVLFAFVGTAVPICACERLGPAASLRRAVALVRGNRLQLLGACILLEVLVVVVLIVIGIATVVLADAMHDLIPWDMAWVVALFFESLFLGMGVGVMMALGIAAYGRLRCARVELDVDAWVEVFR